jgi:hypothetical protein
MVCLTGPAGRVIDVRGVYCDRPRVAEAGHWKADPICLLRRAERRCEVLGPPVTSRAIRIGLRVEYGSGEWTLVIHYDVPALVDCPELVCDNGSVRDRAVAIEEDVPRSTGVRRVFPIWIRVGIGRGAHRHVQSDRRARPVRRDLRDANPVVHAGRASARVSERSRRSTCRTDDK